MLNVIDKIFAKYKWSRPLLFHLLVMFIMAFNGSAQAKVLVSITAKANLKYVRVSEHASKDMVPTRTGIGTWEVYEYIDLGGDEFALKSLANGKYVTVENDDLLYANRNAIGILEKFKKINLSNGYQAIRSLKNNKYVVAENAGNGSLKANRDSIGEWEQFVISDVVDVWEAVTAFANNYPYQLKQQTSGYGLIYHKELIEGNFLWMLELFPDNTHVGEDPSNPDLVGHPVWNKYGLQYFGDWETFVSYGTAPHYNQGETWVIPRSRRYALAFTQHDSPQVSAYHSSIAKPDYPNSNGCTITLNNNFYPPPTEWGRVYASYVKDLTEFSSAENMGSRWVMDIGYKDFNEVWTIDLGPQMGVFEPKYGVVSYGSVNKSVVANIQDDSTHVITPKRCSY